MATANLASLAWPPRIVYQSFKAALLTLNNQMETNEPPHAGNHKGSSLCPPAPSQRAVQESCPIHILLLYVQLIIIRSRSPPPPPASVVYLLIFSITLTDWRLRIGLGFGRTIGLWYITLLGPIRCVGKGCEPPLF